MLCATAFYGVLHLSKELENPYGWDFNDIDLNSFQKALHEDLMTIHACAFGMVRDTSGPVIQLSRYAVGFKFRAFRLGLRMGVSTGIGLVRVADIRCPSWVQSSNLQLSARWRSSHWPLRAYRSGPATGHKTPPTLMLSRAQTIT